MDLRELIGTQTDVSLSLAKHLLSTEAKENNAVFSPLSIHVVLGLIAAGSSGETQNQILTFLKSKSIDDVNSLSSQLVTVVFSDGSSSGGPLLSFANGVWVDQSLPFKAAFKKIVDDIYKAASNQVDFQNKPVEVMNEVNSWAEKGTHGLIKELLPPGSVDSSTKLILANALYYKGTWNEKFDGSKTKEHEFYLLNGNTVQAPFMTSRRKQYISSFDGLKVLRLPYKQGEDKRQFSMYLLLPDAKDGLPSLLDRIDSEPGFLKRHLPCVKVSVGEFRIPKFKISFGFEASNLLKALGVVQPFSGEGLTEMVDSSVSKNLYVSKIFHKSFIEFNEEGTEAGSATAAVILLRSAMMDFEEEINFVADHPFLFLIREDMTGVVLFCGSVLNPLAN